MLRHGQDAITGHGLGQRGNRKTGTLRGGTRYAGRMYPRPRLALAAPAEEDPTGQPEGGDTQGHHQEESHHGNHQGHDRHDERIRRAPAWTPRGLPRPPLSACRLQPQEARRPLDHARGRATRDDRQTPLEERRQIGEHGGADKHPRDHRRGRRDGVQRIVQPGDVVGQDFQQRGRGEGVERRLCAHPLEPRRQGEVAGLRGEARRPGAGRTRGTRRPRSAPGRSQC